MATRFLMEKINPKGYAAMLGLEKYIMSSSIDKKLNELLKIRASQINGCDYCVDYHSKDARKLGETEERMNAVSDWKNSSLFAPEEKAVLALTESITLISETHVPDDVYNEVRKYFDENQTADIIMAIIIINAWNRIAIFTRK